MARAKEVVDLWRQKSQASAAINKQKKLAVIDGHLQLTNGARDLRQRHFHATNPPSLRAFTSPAPSSTTQPLPEHQAQGSSERHGSLTPEGKKQAAAAANALSGQNALFRSGSPSSKREASEKRWAAYASTPVAFNKKPVDWPVQESSKENAPPQISTHTKPLLQYFEQELSRLKSKSVRKAEPHQSGHSTTTGPAPLNEDQYAYARAYPEPAEPAEPAEPTDPFPLVNLKEALTTSADKFLRTFEGFATDIVSMASMAIQDSKTIAHDLNAITVTDDLVQFQQKLHEASNAAAAVMGRSTTQDPRKVSKASQTNENLGPSPTSCRVSAGPRDHEIKGNTGCTGSKSLDTHQDPRNKGPVKAPFEVESVVARRYVIYDNICGPCRLQYLVRWTNYGPEEDVWYDAENLLDCKNLVDAFELENPMRVHPEVFLDQPGLIGQTDDKFKAEREADVLHNRTAGDRMMACPRAPPSNPALVPPPPVQCHIPASKMPSTMSGINKEPVPRKNLRQCQSWHPSSDSDAASSRQFHLSPFTATKAEGPSVEPPSLHVNLDSTAQIEPVKPCLSKPPAVSSPEDPITHGFYPAPRDKSVRFSITDPWAEKEKAQAAWAASEPSPSCFDKGQYPLQRAETENLGSSSEASTSKPLSRSKSLESAIPCMPWDASDDYLDSLGEPAENWSNKGKKRAWRASSPLVQRRKVMHSRNSKAASVLRGGHGESSTSTAEAAIGGCDWMKEIDHAAKQLETTQFKEASVEPTTQGDAVGQQIEDCRVRLLEMGFSPNMAQDAAVHAKGDVSKAVDELEGDQVANEIFRTENGYWVPGGWQGI